MGSRCRRSGERPIKTNLLPPEIARAMAWKSKQPWFIGAAACIGLAVAGVGGYVWNERSAFASSQTGDAHQHNDAVIGQVGLLKTQWGAKVNQGQFDQEQGQIEQAMMLANARRIWPMLTLDVYQSLPQAQGSGAAATQPAGSATQPAATQEAGATTEPIASRTIVLTHILSDYFGQLSAQNLSGTAANLPQVQAPDTDGQRGERENAATGAPSTTPTVNPAALQATEGPSDHGFVVTITGYVPETPGWSCTTWCRIT